MDYAIFDIEADGLLEAAGEGKPAATKIHCMSVRQYKDGILTIFSFTTYNEMADYLYANPDIVLVGHKIITYDIPMLEKFLQINLSGYRQIDTLGLSWYLYPKRLKHGLDEWGEDLGIQKPPIDDWKNLAIEIYIHRCNEDTKINDKLFDLQMDYLFRIYGEREKVHRFINYLMYKLHCAREQEEVKWKLDVPKCEANLSTLLEKTEEKRIVLRAMMPTVTKYKKVARPKNVYKQNGEPSVVGQRWLDLLTQFQLPHYHIGTLKVPVSQETGNPNSPEQLKQWLFSLGWEPITFKYEKQKDGSIKKIPQLSKDDNSGDICDSVSALFEANPGLENLAGLFVLKHRVGILKGFLENRNENDFLKAEIKGFTNTLRFQHTIIVNLPQIPKPYWEEVRGCLIAPDENHVLCGSDMSGLEDNTKRHYMYYHDPAYVDEMRTYGFDSHTDIAVQAGKISRDEECFFKYITAKKDKKDYERILKEYYERELSVELRKVNSLTGFTLEELLAMPEDQQAIHMKTLKAMRLKTKKVNFAGVYGAGAAKIALTGNMPLGESKEFHTIYWRRNWSVKKIANTCKVVTIGEQMWLFNPVSQFWYSLRAEKDKFSTLNQGTGVYCFDSWVRKVRAKSIRNCGQFHDEIISPVLKGTEEEHSSKLKLAIKEANEELQLNVELGISIDFGDNYAQIH